MRPSGEAHDCRPFRQRLFPCLALSGIANQHKGNRLRSNLGRVGSRTQLETRNLAASLHFRALPRLRIFLQREAAVNGALRRQVLRQIFFDALYNHRGSARRYIFRRDRYRITMASRKSHVSRQCDETASNRSVAHDLLKLVRDRAVFPIAMRSHLQRASAGDVISAKIIDRAVTRDSQLSRSPRQRDLKLNPSTPAQIVSSKQLGQLSELRTAPLHTELQRRFLQRSEE